MDKKLIKFNVGGTLFTTKYSTIEKSEYLKMLVDNKHKITDIDEKGNICIDRSPTMFSVILNVLRGHIFDAVERLNITVREHVHSSRKIIKCQYSILYEFKFYEIDFHAIFVKARCIVSLNDRKWSYMSYLWDFRKH